MLEYMAYKKFKKNRDAKVSAREDVKDEAALAASVPRSPGATTTTLAPEGPVLTDDDELFFERLTHEGRYADEDGKRPPLPPRAKTPDYSWDSSDTDGDSLQQQGAKKGQGGLDVAVADPKASSTSTDEKKPSGKSRLAFWVRRQTSTSQKSKSLEPASAAAALSPAEEARESEDLSRVLDDLNLAARNNKTFSLSQDSQELVGQFTAVLKDLVNGVPTAATDLRHLFEDHDGTLARNYEKLPGSMKKLVTSLPAKLTGTLAPELLAVAAESQGLRGADAPTGGLKDQALKLVMPKNLSDLVTKPSAIVGMLKAIMNALKLRWPAFIGTNVIWSVALFCEQKPFLFFPRYLPPSLFRYRTQSTDGEI